ncbi:MAG TPA: major capsid protein [Candidatus Paceibacterota bacterium]
MATPVGLDRLVRKEVSLGSIREIQPPQDHIGLAQIAPFLDVATDDVIFDYLKGGLQDGLAPARAEDAEAELAQKDQLYYGEGRASIIDWALKDKYTASDVTRYREDLLIRERLQGTVGAGGLPTSFVGRSIDDFENRVARDDAARRRKLDNRIEWMIMSSLENGTLAYNDGKIKWTVDWGRPADQHNQVPSGGLWSLTTCDPIGDLLAAQQLIYTRYGVTPRRGLMSTRIMNSLWKSSRFLAAVGVPVVGGTPSSTLDPNYLGLSGYTPAGALAIVEQATGINFTIYDSVYRTRPIGSGTYTNNRFVSDDKVILWPSEAELGEINDTSVGFAKTLTAPHPEGNWTSGYYEWEDEKKDPWMHVRGTGIKAFPVFPYMEYTFSYDVLT